MTDTQKQQNANKIDQMLDALTAAAEEERRAIAELRRTIKKALLDIDELLAQNYAAEEAPHAAMSARGFSPPHS